MLLNNITFEISSKAFTDDSEECMKKVSRTLLRQWQDLIGHTDKISVMTWIADGSEILDYSGNLDDTFEWAYWLGCAEPLPHPENITERNKKFTHWFPVKYREDAKPRKYAWLKRMIEVLRETAMEMLGKPVRLIATFDNGPEFALSDFKYRRHNEICQGSTVGHNRSVACNLSLHADKRCYAAFPKGIEEGTSVGTFLGAQFRKFARDMGYDALWLSNGMGFGRDTWGITGYLFDKTNFHPEAAEAAANTMLKFWKDLTEACPGIVIETRGSNFSAGVEMATDAAPLTQLYRDFKIAPPVNSPWAALNFNTGLELAAWMSHVAELPDQRFPYRFYIHDPWFNNSPWLDRYGREPWDIFLPLSISRIKEDGTVQIPNSISLLSVDDSFGRMPDIVPREVTPHLLDAFENAPDRPGPLIWLYPFSEYSEMVHGKNPHPETVMNEDLFIGECLQAGFPLNTVVSSDIFTKVAPNLQGILVIPASLFNDTIHEFLCNGGNAIFYGSLANADKRLLKWLGLSVKTPLTGAFTVKNTFPVDVFSDGEYSKSIMVHAAYDNGGLCETAKGAEIVATATQNKNKRVLASVMYHGTSQVAFVRSVLPMGKKINPGYRDLDKVGASVSYPIESLMRSVLVFFDWYVYLNGNSERTPLPRMNMSRHDNAFYFSVFSRDTTASLSLSTPYGAPLLDEIEVKVFLSLAHIPPLKCMHKACRCFVEQEGNGVISAKIAFPQWPQFTGRRVYSGLNNATLRFFPPLEYKDSLEITPVNDTIMGGDQHMHAPLPFVWKNTPDGLCAEVKGVSGAVSIGW